MRGMSMNDDIEKLNAENDRQNQSVSPGNQSQAAHSSITTPDEDRRSIAQGIIDDLSNQRADIDVIKQTITVIGNQMNQLTQALNQMMNGQNPQVQGQPVQGLNPESVSVIADLAEKGVEIFKMLKGGNNNMVDEFTQTIVDRSKQEAMQSLDIVSLINQKVKKKLVNDIAGDLGATVINKESNNNHAPE